MVVFTLVAVLLFSMKYNDHVVVCIFSVFCNIHNTKCWTSNFVVGGTMESLPFNWLVRLYKFYENWVIGFLPPAPLELGGIQTTLCVSVCVCTNNYVSL